MFDLSPEKLMVLLAVGLVVVGPHRLPSAAQTLARGLLRVRNLADILSSPVHASLQEPRRIVDDALAELRATVAPTPPTATGLRAPSPPDGPRDPNTN